MRHINEYLLSKSKNKTFDDFKQFETKKEVCDFFDSKGFDTFESDHYTYDDMISEFLNSDKPICCMGNFNSYAHNWWVRFGKGGKDEYIFFWNVKGTMSNDYSVNDSNDQIIKIFKTFKEFKYYVTNYFGW